MHACACSWNAITDYGVECKPHVGLSSYVCQTHNFCPNGQLFIIFVVGVSNLHLLMCLLPFAEYRSLSCLFVSHTSTSDLDFPYLSFLSSPSSIFSLFLRLPLHILIIICLVSKMSCQYLPQRYFTATLSNL